MDVRWKIYRRILWGMFTAGTVGLLFYTFFFFYSQIPDEIRLNVQEIQEFDWDIPVSASFTEMSAIENAKQQGKEIHVTMERPFSVLGTANGSYRMDCKLFGVIPLKSVSVDVVEKEYVTPGGNIVGVYLKTKGVLAVGTSPVTAMDGKEYEPAQDVIYSGDYIEAVNGKVLKSKEDLVNAVADCDGRELLFEIRRDGNILEVRLLPILGTDGTYKLGVWVRDNAQGIGTLTYVDEEGRFGALGHSINDMDTSTLMEIEGGSLFSAKVLSIVKGEKGDPGEVLGMITYDRTCHRGEIESNTNAGVYGTAEELLVKECKALPMEVGRKQEIKLGTADIRCAMEGEMKEYEVQIEEIHLSRDDVNKGILLRVMDEELLEVAGGIVQGMSGSPIIQDGKLVGAVTHVLVNDPTRGYGIFIENMLEAAE